MNENATQFTVKKVVEIGKSENFEMIQFRVLTFIDQENLKRRVSIYVNEEMPKAGDVLSPEQSKRVK